MRARVRGGRTPRCSPLFLLAGLAACLAGCASATHSAAAASADRPLVVIDAHVHTAFTDTAVEPGKVMNSSAELAAEMKRYNVVGAVSIGRPADPDGEPSGPSVVRCAGIAANTDPARLEADLASGRFRCLTIYLGQEGLYPSDPHYDPVYRVAERFKVPVVFDTVDREARDTHLKAADPRTTAGVAAAHPAVTFVLTHEGRADTADERQHADYLQRHSYRPIAWPFDDDPWIIPAAAVVNKNPNVFLDGSAFLIGDIRGASAEQIKTYVLERVRWLFGSVGPSKLMFGTAWPETEIGPYFAAFAHEIPQRHWRAIFHDNAARVYGLDRKPNAK